MSIHMTLQGSFVALITPLKDGAIDEKALRHLVDWHHEKGTAGIVAVGTTGESATLSDKEHLEVIRIIADQAGPGLAVIAGTGSNSTREAIDLTKAAADLGVAASLQVCPYYNKPSQDGLYQHFEAIAQASPLPMILYNVPSRTAVNLLPKTVERLATIKNIVAIKEASGDLRQVQELIKLCGPEFIVLSGEDAQNDEIMALGGKGVISVTANIVPAKMAIFCSAMNEGSLQEGRSLHRELMPLHEIMFIETNPIPVKTALAMMGMCEEEFFLPLCPLSPDNRVRLETRLKELRLI
jgi:4-hydroxy-tetrahydrodipicolinate synthase